MAGRGGSEWLLVHTYHDGVLVGRPDELIVEEPLAIQLDGHLVTTTMRTPGHDLELAVGFCHSEGLLGGAAVSGCAYFPAVELNVVSVETGGRAPVPKPRLGPITSACGLCGSATLADLHTRLSPLPASQPIELDLLFELASRVRANQPLFDRTGAVHAAAAFDAAGELVAVREDIGRHNAVDKVVGHLLLGGELPARSMGLFVSSRASFEMVQKAWAAGFGMLVAVSAPSALAVQTARTANLTLVGFLREDRFSVYAPEQGSVSRPPRR